MMTTQIWKIEKSHQKTMFSDIMQVNNYLCCMCQTDIPGARTRCVQGSWIHYRCLENKTLWAKGKKTSDTMDINELMSEFERKNIYFTNDSLKLVRISHWESHLDGKKTLTEDVPAGHSTRLHQDVKYIVISKSYNVIYEFVANRNKILSDYP